MSGTLHWLPQRVDWNEALRSTITDGTLDWATLVTFARFDLDFTQTIVLDRALRAFCGGSAPAGLETRPIRLAVLASCSVDHLLPGIRVAGLRRGLWIETYAPDYGQYLQAVADPRSALGEFAPTTVLIVLDGRHLLAGLTLTAAADDADEIVAEAVERCTALWAGVQRRFGCRVIQQMLMPLFEPVLGHNEHRLPGSQAEALVAVNARLRAAAETHDVDILAVDRLAAELGRDFLHDRALWHKAKYEVRPAAAPLYGDHVARLLAARQGRAAKCLVVDLDNTLWGGVIGDDGIDGILLGQGSGPGEAFLEIQHHVAALARRGVIIAVCSKNDEANARLPFESHPEMVLELSDVGCFVANWDDKPANLRRIARALNIGLDSIVFLDDNPFERDIVRAALPMVMVPELPEDPAGFVRALVHGGYFESTGLTADDVGRAAQYQANRARRDALDATTDLDTYLAGLDMVLEWEPFASVDQKRVVQLINKTNQFNVTTRRHDDEAVRAMMRDPNWLTFQARLSDCFGDNGIIAVIAGRLDDRALLIDTWLMSCRVLGRRVEQALLGMLVDEARRHGATRLLGEYVPTAKNGMVADLFYRLGFVKEGGASSYWVLDVAGFVPAEVPLQVRRVGEMADA